jgi:hypothetical protein
MCPIPQPQDGSEQDQMATTVTEVSELLKEAPAGAWVAISESRNAVIAFGADPQSVLNEAREKGEELPLITRVPDQDLALFL